MPKHIFDFCWMGDMSVRVLWGSSPAGKEKVAEILSQPETQSFGNSGVVVEARYVEDLQARLEEEGFTFRGEN